MSGQPATKPTGAAFSGERKKWGLRAAKKPQKYYDLAGVAIVKGQQSTYVCYLRFTDALVEAVGQVMPRGVGPEDQAYLEVHHTLAGFWEVWAAYISLGGGKDRRLLWVQEEKPPWVT